MAAKRKAPAAPAPPPDAPAPAPQASTELATAATTPTADEMANKLADLSPYQKGVLKLAAAVSLLSEAVESLTGLLVLSVVLVLFFSSSETRNDFVRMVLFGEKSPGGQVAVWVMVGLAVLELRDRHVARLVAAQVERVLTGGKK